MSIQNLFSSVLEASIFGSTVGIILFIFKSTILCKISAKWQHMIWFVMILKLIFPNGPESKISIFNKLNMIISEKDLLSIAQKPEIAAKTHLYVQDTFSIIPYLWLIGFTVTALWAIFSFVSLKLKLHSSSAASAQTVEILNKCKEITGIKKDIKVVVQNHIFSASLCGIVHPKILITEEFEKSDINHIEYTFIHELSHYKRCDISVNYILLILQCIHWFNPVIWYLFGKIRRDTELATDEQTMLYIQPEKRKNYGTALINAISTGYPKVPKLLGMANNKKDITKRIKAIAKFKKPGFFSHLSGIITMVAISIVCLTSAVVAKPISDAIYRGIPKIGVTSINNDTVVFGQQTDTETENVIEKPDESEKSEEFENDTSTDSNFIEELTVDRIISTTGQTIDNGSGTTDLNNYAKIVQYNSDNPEIHTITVKPNSSGVIQFFIENEGYDHSVKIGISNIENNGLGWDYQFSTEGKTPIYLDGYYPDEEYVITIDSYCPGYYNINGKILIY